LPEVPVVLAIDDEEPVLALISDALREGGFEVMEARSGDEAVTALTRATYSALVTDINLKGEISGWEIAKQAREINPNVAVVYASGGTADEWASQGVPNSIFLEKPFAPAQVVTAVSQLLNTGTPT
jgi:DNA-binding response OmpR family regulator